MAGRCRAPLTGEQRDMLALLLSRPRRRVSSQTVLCPVAARRRTAMPGQETSYRSQPGGSFCRLISTSSPRCSLSRDFR